MIRTILCPVDLTDRACQAVGLARDLAQRLGARVVLHHDVAAAPPSPLGVAWMWSEDHEGEVEERTAEAAGRLQTLLDGLPPGSEAKLTRGPLDESVQQVGREVDADLLVIGSRGRRSPGDQSLTERLALSAPWAVLALGDQCDAGDLLGASASASEPTPMVVPTDFSRRSLRAVEYAFDLAGRLPVAPQLVHACGADRGAHGHQAAQAAEARLHALVPDELAARVTVSVGHGAAAEVILERARDSGAGFVLMASHRKGALRRAVFGTTALAVLRASRIPVWFVHDPPTGAKLGRLLHRAVE